MMTETQSIKRVAVVGGGSAGYISALYLKKSFPEMDVTVIESSKIPVVGVGEATTQTMPKFLHGLMGFPVREFVEETKPTIKLGIHFAWGKREVDHYNSPFDLAGGRIGRDTVWSGTECTLFSMLMEKAKTPFYPLGESVKVPDLGSMAYHIHNKHFLGYLKAKLAVLGCVHLDREITEVKLHPEKREVLHLVTDDGEARAFDLYVDCSGFRSLLLGGALKSEWMSYAGSLKTNRAVLGMRANAGEILPYTTAATMKHGWLWNTPMQDEDHLGYVFSGEHCTDEEALEELQAHCETVQQGRVVTFRTGRFAESWVGNVVGIGNSFAFIEPLESTGIHMILQHLRSLASVLKKGPVTAEQVKKYNREIGAKWDHLRWFVALHFKFNQKLDTAFWQDCRRDIDVSGIEEYLDFYAQHGPLSSHPESPLYAQMDAEKVFSVFAHDAHLEGCGVATAFRSPALRSADVDPRLQVDRAAVRVAMGHRESLRYLEGNEYPLSVRARN